MQQSLFLLPIPGMRESIREGLETPVDTGKAQITLRLE